MFSLAKGLTTEQIAMLKLRAIIYGCEETKRKDCSFGIFKISDKEFEVYMKPISDQLVGMTIIISGKVDKFHSFDDIGFIRLVDPNGNIFFQLDLHKCPIEITPNKCDMNDIFTVIDFQFVRSDIFIGHYIRRKSGVGIDVVDIKGQGFFYKEEKEECD